MDRRSVLSSIVASALALSLKQKSAQAAPATFPHGFLWGAATAGHQIEGNNVSSDVWLVENVKPTVFAEPSGDACNSLELWQQDLDLVRRLGLNSYRFSLEWARIEPEAGQFSRAMLDHYRAIIDGCHSRGINAVVTFSHCSLPRWFAAKGSWTNRESPDLFARFCERAARELAPGIAYAVTLNEPNNGLKVPSQFLEMIRAANSAAGVSCNAPAFRMGVLPDPSEIEVTQTNLRASHQSARAAIKAARSSLPVGFSLALEDYEAVGSNSIRDAQRALHFGPWLELAKSDDFLGVQNYDRVQWDDKGRVPAPKGAMLSPAQNEIYPPSLANAVRYAYATTGVPILVTEHGLETSDDSQRAQHIPASLIELQKVTAEGIPVKGYIHWTLLDNFEWFAGYRMKYGLCSVDRATFRRAPKPSAAVLGTIAGRNAV